MIKKIVIWYLENRFICVSGKDGEAVNRVLNLLKY